MSPFLKFLYIHVFISCDKAKVGLYFSQPVTSLGLFVDSIKGLYYRVSFENILLFQVSLATFATYIFTKEDHRFDPQTAFVAMTLFNILRFGLNMAPMMAMEFVKGFVSLKRISKYLNSDDIDPLTVSQFSSGNNVVLLKIYM